MWRRWRNTARSLPDVAPCGGTTSSPARTDTQDLIAKRISGTRDLNRIVVAACTPRTHEALFQETLRAPRA